MTSRKNEAGQSIVIVVVFLVVLCGMAALVLDIGVWFRTDRQLQATADAAALAGVQELPKNGVLAKAVAFNYAEKNGGNVALGDIVVDSNTVTVTAKKEEPGFFSQVLGFGDQEITARAKARIDSPLRVRYVAPMVVHCGHPLIQNCDGNGSPTFNVPTALKFDKFGAPGAFGMLNLGKKGGDTSGSGTPGTSEQAEWILRGFDKYLDHNEWYRSNPGAKFEGNEIEEAFEQRMQPDSPPLLFPVFLELKEQGQNADFYVIGWIGFKLTSFTSHGHNVVLTGYFTEFIANGILAASGSGMPTSFGVRSVQLIE